MFHISCRFTAAATDEELRSANLRANAWAAASSSSGAWIERTSPPFSASSAPNNSAVITHSWACCMPTRRGRYQLEPASIAMPRLLNTKPMRAAVDIMRMSIGRHMVMPTPTAAPLIAATIGFRQLWIASVIDSLGSRFTGLLPSFHTLKASLPPEMSAPAQKARPAPVMTIARTASSAFIAVKKSINSRLIVWLKALSLSGRLSVTVMTPSCRSVSKVS